MNALLKKVAVVFFSFALFGTAQAEDVPDSIAGATNIGAEQLIDLV